jgi:hypothetical protein
MKKESLYIKAQSLHLLENMTTFMNKESMSVDAAITLSFHQGASLTQAVDGPLLMRVFQMP